MSLIYKEEWNKIKKIIQELLKAGVICPSTIPHSSWIFMVINKKGTYHMYHDFRALNKLMVNDKFPIPIIDDLLDELHGAKFFTKFSVC